MAGQDSEVEADKGTEKRTKKVRQGMAHKTFGRVINVKRVAQRWKNYIHKGRKGP